MISHVCMRRILHASPKLGRCACTTQPWESDTSLPWSTCGDCQLSPRLLLHSDPCLFVEWRSTRLSSSRPGDNLPVEMQLLRPAGSLRAKLTSVHDMRIWGAFGSSWGTGCLDKPARVQGLLGIEAPQLSHHCDMSPWPNPRWTFRECTRSPWI